MIGTEFNRSIGFERHKLAPGLFDVAYFDHDL